MPLLEANEWSVKPGGAAGGRLDSSAIVMYLPNTASSIVILYVGVYLEWLKGKKGEDVNYPKSRRREGEILRRHLWAFGK